MKARNIHECAYVGGGEGMRKITFTVGNPLALLAMLFLAAFCFTVPSAAVPNADLSLAGSLWKAEDYPDNDGIRQVK